MFCWISLVQHFDSLYNILRSFKDWIINYLASFNYVIHSWILEILLPVQNYSVKNAWRNRRKLVLFYFNQLIDKKLFNTAHAFSIFIHTNILHDTIFTKPFLWEIHFIPKRIGNINTKVLYCCAIDRSGASRFPSWLWPGQINTASVHTPVQSSTLNRQVHSHSRYQH